MKSNETMRKAARLRASINITSRSFLGAVEIPLEEVKDIPWFYQDKSPMLHLLVPKKEGVAQAVCEAIKDYFKK